MPRLEPSILFVSGQLDSVALPLAAHSPGAYRGRAGSSRWMRTPTAPGSAAVLPTRCSRSWLSWHPPCPSQHRQTAAVNISKSPKVTGVGDGGLVVELPRPSTEAHLYSPRACHGARSSACGNLTGVQRGEGAQGRGDFGPVPGTLQVSGQWGATARGASYHICNQAQWL